MNLKEEKDKAYKKACADSGEELEDFDFDMGFDAGVLAERNWWVAFLKKSIEESRPIDIYKMFPNKGEG